MSIKAIGWVWDSSQSEGAARLVLLAIADCANAAGTDAWPSIAELCRKTRLSERGVQKAIRKLTEIGELQVLRNSGRGRTNRYRIIMETPPPVRGSGDGNPEPRSPEHGSPPNTVRPQTPNCVRKTPNHVHPEPSGTVTTEPSLGGAPTRGRARETTPGRPRPDGLTPIPDDFRPTDSMRRWAVSTYGNTLDLQYETQQFISHYRSTGARRKSWPDAWQKWVRESAERRTRPRGGTVVPINGRAQLTGTDARVAGWMALAQDLEQEER